MHRYPDRVLLKIASVCPVYCRFCFRREMVGPENGAALSADDLAAALDYIRATPAIWEVILTGGDPLVLSPRRISGRHRGARRPSRMSKSCAGTRACRSVAPERVTEALVAALRAHDQNRFRRRCTPTTRAS